MVLLKLQRLHNDGTDGNGLAYEDNDPSKDVVPTNTVSNDDKKSDSKSATKPADTKSLSAQPTGTTTEVNQ